MRRTRGLPAILLAIGLSGCGAEAKPAPQPPPAEVLPAVSQFRPGPCRSIADPLLALARLANRTADAETVPARDRTELARRQTEISTVDTAADPVLASAVTDLVTAVGFVRLRLDSHSYQPGVMQTVTTARRAVQAACVTA